MCVNICLCVSLCLSMLGCVCFYVPFFLSVCVPLAVYVCVWSVSGYVCVCVCVPWKSQQGTEHVQSEDKGIATRPQKSAETGGSGGAGDNESVRAQESNDILQGHRCLPRTWTVRGGGESSQYCLETSAGRATLANWHLACSVLSPLCS